MSYVHDVVNVNSVVNNSAQRHSAMDRDLADVLRSLLVDVAWLSRWKIEPAEAPGWDLLGSGPIHGGGRGVLCVECKGLNFQPSQFHTIVDRRCSSGKNAVGAKVLAMPRVSERMAALCREHGWSWYDLAGNCRLELPGVFLIARSGKEPIKIEARSGANLSTPEAGRVVRALLAPENAGRRWTQRGVVEHFQELPTPMSAPSLALVNKVVQFLRDQAFVEALPDRGFRVRDAEGLLRSWRVAYRFDRHSQRRCFTLLRGRELQERLRAFDATNPHRVAYGVFSAAELQAPAVRQLRTWLYVVPVAERELMAAIEAKQVDSGENLMLLAADDPGVVYGVDAKADRIACTNAVQTYVDVANASGRGEEAAEAVLEQRLKPAWAAARQ